MNYKERIAKFYDDLKALDMKFPGAEVIEATGYSKGLVSRYLNEKLDPSEDFLDKFYEKFSERLKNVSREGAGKKSRQVVNTDLSKLIQSNADLAESNKALAHSHSELVAMLKEKSGTFSSDVQRFALSQAEILALLKAAIQVDVDYKAKGDPKKAEELAAKIGRATVENLGKTPKKGNPFAGKHGN